MVTRTGQKKRGQISRTPKKMILIGAEGKNKTELTYFKEFNRKQLAYTIKSAKGNSTDPKNIVADMISSITREDLNYAEGDLAFCIFDADTDPAKQRQIDEAVKQAKQYGIEVLLSVPCFEIWFLQHFEASTGAISSNTAIEKLCRYIPEYKKSSNIFFRLEPMIDEAIKRAKHLEKHHSELNRRAKSIERNPSTEAYRLVELLKSEIK